MGRTGGGYGANCGQFRADVIGPSLSLIKPRGVAGVNYGRCEGWGTEVNDRRPVRYCGHCVVIVGHLQLQSWSVVSADQSSAWWLSLFTAVIHASGLHSRFDAVNKISTNENRSWNSTLPRRGRGEGVTECRPSAHWSPDCVMRLL